MELSAAPVPEHCSSLARATALSGGALAAREIAMDVEVPLPADLRQFGPGVRATATGNPLGAVVVALGGISGNRFVCRCPEGGPGWWAGLIGTGRAIDPARHLIVGMDFAADASGRAAPSTEEQARVLCAALDALGLQKADAIVGASYGGMVALALAEHHPERVGALVIISAPSEPHPTSTANRELQRRVVALGIESGRGDEALAIARGMAMLTYRTPKEFEHRFQGGIGAADPLTESSPCEYLLGRGRHFRSVMSPERFLSLSASVDRHWVDPRRIGCPALLIGATSDQLVPPAQMIALRESLGTHAELHLLDCLFGHDMFLKEAAACGDLIAPFLAASCR